MSTALTPIGMRQCRWCGNLHGEICPYVSAIEYHPDGFTVKRVEFRQPWPDAARYGPDLSTHDAGKNGVFDPRFPTRQKLRC